MPRPKEVAPSIWTDFPGFQVEYLRALSHIRLSDVAVAGIADHRVALEQLTYTIIKRERRLETGCLDLGVGNDVITLIWVLPHWRLDEHEV